MPYISDLDKYVDTSDVGLLVGLTLTRFDITEDRGEINLESNDGRKFRFYHSQDCCESVAIEEVHGELSDLINSPILQAEESTNSEGNKPNEYSDSWLWTFYRFTTIKGSVTIRWLGESNGYYSESVDFVEVPKD